MKKSSGLWLDRISSLSVIAASVVLVWRVGISPMGVSTGRTAPPVEAEVAEGNIGALGLRYVDGTAATVIVEFSDFECPFCRAHAVEVLPKVRRELIEAGKASYAMLHFPLTKIHDQALAAARLAECSGRQGAFWRMHDRLFNTAPLAFLPNGSSEDVNALGLDDSKVRACLDSDAQHAVEQDIRQAVALKVSGTPTFFVGTKNARGGVDIKFRLQGAAPLAALRQTVERVQQGQLR